MTPRPGRPLLRATTIAGATLVTLCLLGAIGALAHMRAQVSAAATDLDRTAQAIPPLKERPAPEEIQQFVAAVPAPLVLTGKAGQEVARTGPPTGLWDRPSAHWTARLATIGLDVRLVDGAVDASRDLGNGRNLDLRRDIGVAATRISGATAAIGAIAALLLALIAGAVAYVLGRRRSARLVQIAAAAESIASGRETGPDDLPNGGEFGRVADALRTTADRQAHLSEVAERELGVLTAAIEPLPFGVAGKGPTGSRLRNLALQRLRDELGVDDRAAVDAAIQTAMDGTGPVGERVTLRDGRMLEVDGWTVPGGRLVSVAERTEQERLAHLRRQLESSAVRQLRAPIDEIIARGRELYQQVPAPAASKLRSIFAATDRLDRVVRMLLRGTPHDPALRPPRRETFGVAGLLWGLVHDWDSALRQRALRVELEIAPDLPDVRTDPALVEEILTELVDNSAKYTPRGGTIALAARAGEASVIIDVRDSGTGFSHEDVPHATERFFRGQHAESIPGAGLGLGVAAALAERIGGTLVIQPGPGGHVQLELPARASVFEPALAGTAATT